MGEKFLYVGRLEREQRFEGKSCYESAMAITNSTPTSRECARFVLWANWKYFPRIGRCISCWKYFRGKFLTSAIWTIVWHSANGISHKILSVGDCNGVGMLPFPQKLFSAASSMAQWFFLSRFLLTPPFPIVFLLTKLFSGCLLFSYQ